MCKGIDAFRSRINEVLELPDEDASLLMTCVTKQEFKKRDVLLQEGEVCRAFYLVSNGYLRTYYNKDGVAINLNFTFERSFATNLKSYKSKKPSELIIEAGEDSSVWIFNLKLIV